MNRKSVNTLLALLIVLTAVIVVYRGRARSEQNQGYGIAKVSSVASDRSGQETRTRARNAQPQDKILQGVSIDKIGYDLLAKIAPQVSQSPFATFSDNGKITKGALAFAGVDPSKRSELQAAVDRAYREVEESISNRMQLVPGESDPTSGVTVYQIPAARAEGEAIFRKMAEEMKSLIGEKKTLMLISGMDLRYRYSHFGMNNVRIEVVEKDHDPLHPERAYGISIVETNPVSNTWVSTSNCSMERFKARFGNVYGKVFGTQSPEK